MTERATYRIVTSCALILLLIVAVACGERTQAPEETASAEPAAEAAAAGSGATLLAVLDAADRFDGATDKVVSKCAGCALGMDGSSEHSLHVEGYEMHFCSEGCKEGFAENAKESVLALEVPEG